MADGDTTELNADALLSAQEIDEVVSQFRLFSRQLSQQQVHAFVSELPRLTEADLIASGRQDDVCPICFNPFLATLAEEEVAHALDSPAHPVDELGVTRLQNTCGHMFCRKDIAKWITQGHDSCPACRQPLIAEQHRHNSNLEPEESWLRPWAIISDHLQTYHGFSSAEDDRHELTGMYS